ncbi:MAG TPA: hypothetical protein VGI60_16625 [Chthoniobacterales bacterium]|jgi:hypothetical protein
MSTIFLLGLFVLTGLLLVCGHALIARRLLPRKFTPGVPIIYRMQAMSEHPVHDACYVYPAEKGEFYYYVRKKYWRVEKVLQDGWIVARTPFMEQHYLRRDDPNLRKANLVERLRYATRFPYPAWDPASMIH